MALNPSVTLSKMLLADHSRAVDVPARDLLEPHGQGNHVLRSRQAVDALIKPGAETTPLASLMAKGSAAAATSRFI